MTGRRALLALLWLLLPTVALAAGPGEREEQEWVQLFNGKNFDGRFGHLFYKEPLSHYQLRVEYRFVGDQVPGGPDWAFRNSGIMIHGESPESMGLDQSFPVSLEFQLL